MAIYANLRRKTNFSYFTYNISCATKNKFLKKSPISHLAIIYLTCCDDDVVDNEDVDNAELFVFSKFCLEAPVVAVFDGNKFFLLNESNIVARSGVNCGEDVAVVVNCVGVAVVGSGISDI